MTVLKCKSFSFPF
uniref:Uncharacterized protein n=1 Tax=Anguilla anguilla TaxID=7936 RepID=A0A0E9T487_ANGAN